MKSFDSDVSDNLTQYQGSVHPFMLIYLASLCVSMSLRLEYCEGNFMGQQLFFFFLKIPLLSGNERNVPNPEHNKLYGE